MFGKKKGTEDSQSENSETLTLSVYQEKAITTKIYRDEVALPYVVLGLCGEAAEMKEKSIELIRNAFSQEIRVEFAKEVGDVAWYMAAIASETKQDLGDFGRILVFESNGNSNLEEAVDTLLIQAGGIAEVMKKALRDNYEEVSSGRIPQDKLSKINNFLSKLIVAIQVVCVISGLDFSQILQENIDKLQSRKERNTLGGSGDNR